MNLGPRVETTEQSRASERESEAFSPFAGMLIFFAAAEDGLTFAEAGCQRRSWHAANEGCEYEDANPKKRYEQPEFHSGPCL